MIAGLMIFTLLGLWVTSVTATDLPAARGVELTTQDGVVLKCHFYPGAAGKDSIPVILLHGWTGPRGAGSRRDLDHLATLLHQSSHAVIVPDLRGHGSSIIQRNPLGMRRRLHRDAFADSAIAAMVQYDLEAVKTFLLEEHRHQELNIELLTVVGAEMGAVVGAAWAAQDWSWPVLRQGKQGQDVRALVLISPRKTFRGLSLTQALQTESLLDLPTMIVFGNENTSEAAEVERISRPEPRASLRDPLQRRVTLKLPTSLQGTDLLEANLQVEEEIAKFVDSQLVPLRKKLPWQPRGGE